MTTGWSQASRAAPASQDPPLRPLPLELQGKRPGKAAALERGARMAGVVKADPYPWPYDGNLVPTRTALVLVDWQQDFCGVGGYVDRMGYDISLTRRGIAPTQE